MNYSMYIGINGGEEGFSVPVLPEKIEFSEGGTNKTYDVIRLGEVNTIGTPKLTDITYQSFFPKNIGNYVNADELFEPTVYVKKIKEWREDRQKIRFIFLGEGIQINDLFTIENFKFWEESGQVGDIYYSLDLKRYKNYSPIKLIKEEVNGVTVLKKQVPKRGVEKKKISFYKAVHGEDLFLIAKKCLGDGARWKEIYDLNKNVIKSSKDVYQGQVFKLP